MLIGNFSVSMNTRNKLQRNLFFLVFENLLWLVFNYAVLISEAVESVSSYSSIIACNWSTKRVQMFKLFFKRFYRLSGKVKIFLVVNKGVEGMICADILRNGSVQVDG